MLTNISGGFEIKAISTTIAKNELKYVDDMKNFNFPEKNSLKLKRLMGYDTHRIASQGQTTRYFCEEALKDIFDNTDITADSIDGLISVAQSPDYFIPYNSGIIQRNLGLKEDIFTLDISQGCAGYVMGLMQAFMTLKLSGINRIALVVGDVSSARVSKKDRNSFPLACDAGSATIIDINPKFEQNVTYYYKSIGEKCLAINIPASGFAKPSTKETAQEIIRDDGNIRSDNDVVMDGVSVFAFTQKYVAQMIEDTLKKAKVQKEKVDYFLLHQPNKFMVSKIATQLGISYEKVPMNICTKYGNPSTASIPLLICDNADILRKNNQLLFSGFGAGLSLASIYMKLNAVNYIKLIER